MQKVYTLHLTNDAYDYDLIMYDNDKTATLYLLHDFSDWADEITDITSMDDFKNGKALKIMKEKGFRAKYVNPLELMEF